MKGLVFLVFGILILFPFVSAAVIFSDDFESGTLGGWNLYSGGDGVNWTVSLTNPQEGVWYAESKPRETTQPASSLERDISTLGYSDVSLSYYRRLVGIDAADEFNVSWYNGSRWIPLEGTGGASANDGAYLFRTYSLGVGADDSSALKIRFECTAGAVTEFCRVDNVTLNGTFAGDSVFPLISYVFPSENNDSYLSRNYVLINITVSDSFLSNVSVYLFNASGIVNISNSTGTALFVNFSELFDGVYYFNATAADSSNNRNWTETRTVTIDSLKPRVSVSLPLNVSYASSQGRLNYTVFDDYLQACWYSLNGGVSNTSVTCGNNVTGLTSVEGSNTWIVYANDSAGNMNSSSVSFVVDTIAPAVFINYPLNVSYATNVSALNYTSSGMQACWYSLNVGLTNISLLCGNNVTGLSSLEGSNIWIVYSNDSAGNMNSSSITFVKDTISPSISYGVLTEINGSLLSRNYILVNVSASDSNLKNVSILLFNASFSLVNSSNGTLGVLFANFSSLADGIYYFNASVFDGVGISNWTETRMVTIDITAPSFGSFVESPANGTSYVSGATYLFNVSVSESVSDKGIEFNGTNYSLSNLSLVFMFNRSDLGAGTYRYYWWANDTVGNYNVSGFRYYTVVKASPSIQLLLNGNASNLTLGYRNQSNASFSSSVSGSVLYRDGVDVNSEVGLNVSLGAGYYNYTLSVTESQNYSSFVRVLFLNITKASGSVGLLLNGVGSNVSVVYPQQVNASASSGFGSLSLLRDGVSIINENGLNVSLGGGYYDITAISSGDQNYSSVSLVYYVNVSRVMSSCSLSVSPAASVVYGTSTNVSGNCSGAEGSALLFRNNVSVNELGMQVTLGGGNYVYELNVSEGQNYSAASAHLNVSVNRSEGAAELLLNGAAGDLNVSYPQSVNASASSNYGALLLRRNGVDVSSEGGLNVTLGAGQYNYSAVSLGDQNHSALDVNYSVVVSQSVPVIVLVLNGNASNLSVLYPQQINVSVVVSSGSVSLVRDGVSVSGENGLNVSLGAGYYNYTAFVLENQNYSGVSVSRFLNVSKGSLNLNVSLNVNRSEYGVVTVANGTGCESEVICGLFRNSVSVASPDTQSLGVGGYVYVFNSSGNANYSAASSSASLEIVQANGSVALYLNHQRGNMSVQQYLSRYLNASLLVGSGEIEMRLNGSVINSGSGMLGNLTNFSTSGIFLVEGNYYGNQNYSAGNESWYVSVLEVDVVPPVLFVYSPNSGLYRSAGVLVNVSLNENGSVWYSFSNGSTNVSLSSSDNQHFFGGTSLGDDSFGFRAYANDSAGNVNQSDFVAFSVNSFTVSCEVGGPYQDGALVLLQGVVSNSSSGLQQSVNVSVRNGTGVVIGQGVTSAGNGQYYSNVSGLGAGSYTLNVSGSYLGLQESCYDGLSVGGAASLLLSKSASLFSLNTSSVSYHVSLELVNRGLGSSLLTNISDNDSPDEFYSVGSLGANGSYSVSYLRNYSRNASEYQVNLSVARSLGLDSYSGSLLGANSSVISLVVPGIPEGEQVVIVKNVRYVGETSLNVTYLVNVSVTNTGDEDLVGIQYIDSDISGSALTLNVRVGESVSVSSVLVLAKAASNSEYQFALGSATIDGTVFYSNRPLVSIPGYGGPADVIVYGPGSVDVGASVVGVVSVTNMNPDIGQDFVVDYWISSGSESENYSSGQQTAYVAALGMTNVSVSLSGLGVGSYRLRGLGSWAGGSATAFVTFSVVGGSSEGDSGGSGGGGDGGGSVGGVGAVVPSVVVPPVVEEPEIQEVCPAGEVEIEGVCCVDANENGVCDIGEEGGSEQPTAEPITGFFIRTPDVAYKIDLRAILWWFFVILVVIMTIYLLSKLRKREAKVRNRVRSLIGMQVVSSRGKIIGRVSDVILEGNKIGKLKIRLHKRHRGAKGISVPYKLVRGVGDVVVVEVFDEA